MDEDEIRVYGSNPWKPDVERYQLSHDFIHVDYKGEIAWDNYDSSTSYGGSQEWFINLPGEHNYEIKKWGCGLVSAADILLYLSMYNSKFQTEITNKVKYLGNSTVITYESYMAYLLNMDFLYFPINGKFYVNGVDGVVISSGMKKYSKKYGLGLNTHWRWSRNKILPRIKEMLEKDIPVMLSGDRKILEKDGAVYLYKEPDSAASPEEEFSSHYVTVTGLIIDDIKHETWLKVSSWGRCYYINYDQYKDFSNEYSWCMISNVLDISY